LYWEGHRFSDLSESSSTNPILIVKAQLGERPDCIGKVAGFPIYRNPAPQIQF